jgi:Uma2 family endonuclease
VDRAHGEPDDDDEQLAVARNYVGRFSIPTPPIDAVVQPLARALGPMATLARELCRPLKGTGRPSGRRSSAYTWYMVTAVPSVSTSPLQAPEGTTLRLERPGRPYTLAEVDAAGDEGSQWWEADRGVLIVNAPPTFAHQRMVMGMAFAWRTAIDRTRWQVLVGPQRVRLDETTWAEPDVAIWPAGDVDLAAGRPTAELVAEVLSPSSVRRDQRDKPDLYAQAGAHWFVLADPAPDAPTVVIYRLNAGGQHQQVASAVNDEPLRCPLTGADLTPAIIAMG